MLPSLLILGLVMWPQGGMIPLHTLLLIKMKKMKTYKLNDNSFPNFMLKCPGFFFPKLMFLYFIIKIWRILNLSTLSFDVLKVFSLFLLAYGYSTNYVYIWEEC